MSYIALIKDSIWRKDSVYLEGYHYRLSGKREYQRLLIGNPEKYIEHFPPIYIEWSKGRKIFLPTLTVESLKSFDVEVTGPMATLSQTQPYWPDQTQFYRGRSSRENHWPGGYVFAVIDNKIVGFVAYEWSSGFWNQSLTKHYKFPLTPAELEEVFGKPDEVYEFYRD
jgi:hypothetical protein